MTLKSKKVYVYFIGFFLSRSNFFSLSFFPSLSLSICFFSFIFVVIFRLLSEAASFFLLLVLFVILPSFPPLTSSTSPFLYTSSPFSFLSHSFCSYSSHSSHLASYFSSYTSLSSLLFYLLNISANIIVILLLPVTVILIFLAFDAPLLRYTSDINQNCKSNIRKLY